MFSKEDPRAARVWRRLATAGGAVVLAAVVLLAGGPAASAAVTVTPITVNTPDWSGSAGWGSAAPGYSFSQGVVHLSGAVTQVQTGGPNPDLIGWLPFKPSRTVGWIKVHPTQMVYAVVSSGAGTYVDLSIDTAGEIRVIGPRPPAVADYSYVSLDGIIYST